MQHRIRLKLSLALALLAVGCVDGTEARSPRENAAGGTAGAPSAASAAAAVTSTTPEASCGSTPIEDGFVDVSASDPGIRTVGRLDFASPDAPKLAFPAVTIETSFEGDAIDLRLKEGAPGGASQTAYYEVSIDSEAPTELVTCPGQEVYPLARELDAGPHTLRISKRTEAQVGTATFLGFRVREGSALRLPKAPPRLFEFVGDSITCGYGNEVSTSDPDSYPFTSANENALLAYGARTATALDADYVAVAASGRGMVRNYSGGAGLKVPEFYDLTGPDAAWASWDSTRYSPDVIVVNLGTNDFSIGLDSDELATMREDYRQAYVEFLTHLREIHSEATLITAVGPMMSDGYPEGYQAWTSIRADVRAVVDTLSTAGDSNVYYFELAPQSSPYGEDWHPTVATHQRMADALVTFVRETKGW